MLFLDFEAQGRGRTFTLFQGHLKKAILLHKMARVPSDLNTAVYVAVYPNGIFGSVTGH